MAIPVIMPRQGQSVESCIITKWNKQVGDKVSEGDVLFTYETDKATFDEEAKVEGTMLAMFFEEGDDVPCLMNVCVIGEEGEDFEEFRPALEDDDQEVEAAVEEKVQEAVEDVPAPANAPITGDVKISPRARNLAEKHGVDFRYANPTGPNGRIIERDIRALIDSGVMATYAATEGYLGKGMDIEGTGIGGRVSLSDLDAAQSRAQVQDIDQGPEYKEVEIPNIRKVIARAMHNSLSTMAQLTLNSSFDATEILEYRSKLKANREKLGIDNVTINDIILFAVSRTLTQHKDLNANFIDDKMLYFKNVHLGVAMDTPRGLIVPTLFNANKKSLNQISTEVKLLAEDTQKGTISPDLLKGGTFTVTNLGTLGIESFTPVINPPQTGILGVNTIETKVKEIDGEMKFYKAMTLSLTFDHRALDGAPAARFLKDLVYNLENFSLLLAK